MAIAWSNTSSKLTAPSPPVQGSPKMPTFVDTSSIRRFAWKNNGWGSSPGRPFSGHHTWDLSTMASIDRTAYPRFKATLSAQEFQTLYAPTEEEREFVATHTQNAAQQLTLLTLLKCQQSLGYLPAFDTIPLSIRQYLCQQLNLPLET